MIVSVVRVRSNIEIVFLSFQYFRFFCAKSTPSKSSNLHLNYSRSGYFPSQSFLIAIHFILRSKFYITLLLKTVSGLVPQKPDCLPANHVTSPIEDLLGNKP